MTLPLPAPLQRWVLTLLVGLSGLLLAPAARATHLRAGEIQAKVDTTANPNPRRVFFKMILYTSTENPRNATQPLATIFFGDGTSSGLDKVVRANGAGGSQGPGTPITPTTDINIYYFEHTYNASAGKSYIVSFIGENRNSDIVNIPDAVNRTFYIATRITLDPALGINHSPVLKAPAIDRASRNQVFEHNPAAYDADGDSLAYRITQCQSVDAGAKGTIAPPEGTGNNQPRNVVCPGYAYPNDPRFGGTTVRDPDTPTLPVGAPATFSIDNSGTLKWNSPSQLGTYNAAIVVEEWRGRGQARRMIGEVIRDMQIFVEASTNLRPVLTIPADVCVVAGTTVTGTVTATDPESQPVTLYAYSGVIPPATFRQTTLGPPTASGTFSWTPGGNDIAAQPTQVTFKAEDKPPTPFSPLIDEGVWRITVIGPAPTNLVATALPGSRISLAWNRYPYQLAGDERILVYRKEGPSNFNPGPCETGIPASSGFVQIGSVPKDAQSFVDDGGGAGLARGKTYCYRIYVQFPQPKGGASLASAEACAPIQGTSAVLTNVTVDQTSSTNGVITVKWTRPTSVPDFAGPTSYRLSRAEGQSTTFTPVATIANLRDTIYVDRNLNTQASAYTYKLEFFSNGAPGGSTTVAETSPTASSVRLATQPDIAATRVALSWTYAVPWNNTQQPTVIYRRDPGSTTFTQLATITSTATGGTYLDQSTTLRKGQTYCYYVQTTGTYNSSTNPLLNSLLNLSQQQCVVLAAVPCPPVLTIRNNCDSLNAVVQSRTGVFPAPGETYTNQLRWTLDPNNPAGCSTGIKYYRIFYRPAEETQLRLIDSTRTNVMSYQHTGLASQAACYRVQAVDTTGQRSVLSAEVCVDNCLLFVLPNIFTPNGDGINDLFRPKVASPLRRIHFVAYNRWGVRVFESDSNPRIDWTGEAAAAEGTRGGKVSDGVYYYQAEVEFADLNSTKRTYKGWVQINR